ncbi:nickel-dependent lactate racemase [Anaerolentibacter hominis]|uniref:nickel-dependent lactate racemase n=1 Tax=Anaerolentibacter hominis TaxID=3079009 RepID=UPI0031B88A8C
MREFQLPYGKGYKTVELPEKRIAGVLVSHLHDYKPEHTQEELVAEALAHPIGSRALSELAEGKQKVVIIASDHTRPVPSRIIMPLMLQEIRKGNPEAEITILISTGCHRESTKEELINKFGEEIAEKEHIVVHNCDEEAMIDLGKLPSGAELILNRLAMEADLLVAEGFIEPHFFAGFSGGRKSVLPGIAGRRTVLENHCSEFIDDIHSRTGILEGNRIHEDMIFAARKANLAFIVNVIIDSDKKIVHAVAGDCNEAHLAGVDFLCRYCKVDARPADIVITTNGGYPLDQNIYQAVKGLTAAEATIRKDGVIIMLAKSNDGHGAEYFYHTFQEEKDLEVLRQTFLDTPSERTVPDQWQSQIFVRVLQHARVVYISDAPDEVVKEFGMTPAHSMEEALEIADSMLGNPEGKITVIPDGVSVIVL